MDNHEPKSHARLAVSIILVVVIGASLMGAAYLQTNSKQTTSVSATQSGTAASTTGTNTTVCSITGEPFGVVLHVISGSGSPVSGVEVTGESIAYCGSQQQTNQLPPSKTNSSGWVSFLQGDPGNYQLAFSFSGQQYNFAVPTRPTYATYATYTVPSGNLTTTYCFANTGCLGSSTQTSQSSSQSNAGTTLTLNTVLISHFCTNASSIPTSGSATAAANLKFSGNTMGGQYLTERITNDGSSPVFVQAVCIEGSGIGANGTSVQLAVSLSNPIQPGQVGNVSVRFNPGTEVYGLPLRSIEFTVIASDGSSASDSIPVCCGLITQASPTPLISIENLTLASRSYLGTYPELSASVNFNGSAAAMSLEVDINGTYVGTLSLNTNYLRFNALLTIGIIDPGFSIQAGTTYSVTLLATYPGFTTSSATATIVATT